jgi:arylsulfatase A-like enzyme
LYIATGTVVICGIMTSLIVERKMNRGLFIMKKQGLLAVMLISFTTSIYAQKNVIILMADDFNRWTGMNDYYPYPESNTPNIDALATQGIYFSDANSSFPVCNPSRNAFWSGFRPTTSGIISNQGGFIREQTGFESIITMHQYFMQNGYYTVGAGKLYHATSMGAYDTDPDNWNKIIDWETGSEGGTQISWRSSVSGNDVPSWSAGTFNIDEASDTKLANAIAEEITNYNQQDKPFFIACGFFRPHLPWNSHMQFWNLYDTSKVSPLLGYMDNDLDDIPGAKASNYHDDILSNDKWKEAVWAYMASCSYADYNIGIVLDALNKSQFKDNTIVVVCGDHGWHLGEKEQWGKGTEYEQASRTMLTIYDPSSAGNGQICSIPVSLQDVYPTLIDIAGLPDKSDVEGNSLKELLDNPHDANWEKPIMMYAKGSPILKTNEWRLVRGGDLAGTARPQLYNIENDPYEFENLYDISSYASVLQTLEEQLDSILEQGADLRESIIGGTNINATVQQKQKRAFLKNTLVEYGILYLDLLTTDLIAEVSIYSIDGKKIISKMVAGEQDITLFLPEGFRQGTYILQIVSSGKLLGSEKFIVID